MRLSHRFIAVAGAVVGLFLFIRVLLENDVVDTKSGYERRTVSRMKVASPEVRVEEVCVYDADCSAPRLMFRMQAETSNSPPFACLNDIRLFKNDKISHGINVVSLDGSTGDIIDLKSFDVSSSDETFIKWLSNLPDSAIVIAVSFGDVSDRISSHTKTAIAAYGGVKINTWTGGNSYALIGQKGLKASAYEQLYSLSTPNSEMFQACLELPLGELQNISMAVVDVNRLDINKLNEINAVDVKEDELELGEEWENCGMSTPCGRDELSVHFYTGESKSDHPKMCIGGRYVFNKELNKAGRGLNIASIEPKTGRVRKIANFDTYEDSSTGLEDFLDSIPAGDIVAFVSFDEASVMLSDMAKRIIYEMGSSMVYRLKFRASWYFVGQKGIVAYSPFEDLNIPTGNNWAKAIKKSFCLPMILSKWTGRKGSAKANKSINVARRHFCAKHDRNDVFCNEKNLDSFIAPIPLKDRKRVSDPIFNIPILIVAGLAPSSLLNTLNSLLLQEGLNTQMVLIAYDKNYPENARLASLFHARSVAVNGSVSYNDMLLHSLGQAFSLFPDSSMLIVIEEDVVLSPDWLLYLSRSLPLLKDNSKVDLIQTFNPNGFVNYSSRPDVAYISSFATPYFSYILPKKVFQEKILTNAGCCHVAGQWNLGLRRSLIPEVSRISVNQPSRLPPSSSSGSNLFRLPRMSSNGETEINIATVDDLESHIKSSFQIAYQDSECESIKSMFNTKSAIAIIFDQKIDTKQLSTCFGLFVDHSNSIGLHDGIYRFYANNSTDVFIVDEHSQYSSNQVTN